MNKVSTLPDPLHLFNLRMLLKVMLYSEVVIVAENK